MNGKQNKNKTKTYDTSSFEVQICLFIGLKTYSKLYSTENKFIYMPKMLHKMDLTRLRNTPMKKKN